jgi:hypothetical protein
MTTGLVLGVPVGRHAPVPVAEGPAPPEEELALYGLALASLAESAFGSWSPQRRRELGLVRAHLGPIQSRQSLAASFGRESFHRREPVSAETAAARLTSSPVLAAYATRWLELADT